MHSFTLKETPSHPGTWSWAHTDCCLASAPSVLWGWAEMWNKMKMSGFGGKMVLCSSCMNFGNIIFHLAPWRLDMLTAVIRTWCSYYTREQAKIHTHKSTLTYVLWLYSLFLHICKEETRCRGEMYMDGWCFGLNGKRIPVSSQCKGIWLEIFERRNYFRKLNDLTKKLIIYSPLQREVETLILEIGHFHAFINKSWLASSLNGR